MSDLAVFAVIGVGTYVLRSSFIIVVGDRTLPGWAERLLANVGPAVFAALITSLLLTDGPSAFFTDTARVTAVVVAVPVAWKTRNFGWTFAAGMAVFWIVGAMTG